MRIRLVVVEGPDAGTNFVFDGYNRVVVGRGGSFCLRGRRPTDLYMSRFHFLMETAGDVCMIRDLGSRASVYIDGLRVDEGVLNEGAELRAGHTTFRVEFDRTVLTYGGVKPPKPQPPSLRGPSLEDYEELVFVAEGALGVVHQAREKLTGRIVAIKTLHPERELEEGAVDHFLREMDVWRHLHDEHIVRVYAVGRDEGRLWIAMEFVEGPDLEEQFEMRGPLSATDACRVGAHVLSALAYGHGKGIVHRDVKPANILLEGKEGSLSAKVADYGLARNYLDTGGARLTITGDVKGTPSFMAPEQLLDAKRAGPPADVYSVGATLYWALTGTGHLDDGSDPRNQWSRLLEGRFVPLSERRQDLPEPLVEAVDGSLERHPDRRISSARAMAKRIHAAWKECRT